MHLNQQHMATVNSRIIGPLTGDSQFTYWWKSQPVEVPFFDCERIPVTFMNYAPDDDPAFMDEADAALHSFLSFGEAERETASAQVFANCMDFLKGTATDEFDAPMLQMEDAGEVWQFVYPTDIFVSRHPDTQVLYLQVACECEWNPEHGLQLVFKQGKELTRVSAQDGELTH